jgi:Domain of unknown function (DUF4386)
METKMNSIKKTARMAGLLYLIFMLLFIFSSVVRSRIIVFGDAVATANNIMASEWLFRIGFMTDILSAVFFLLAAWALYVVLKSVHKNLALLFLLLNLGGVVIESINMLNLFAALLFLSGADYLKVFQVNQLQSFAMSFLNLYQSGFMIAQVFYGAWLFPLGYLVFKSNFLPRSLGILLMVDCVGILIWFFQFFLLPNYPAISYPSYAIGFIAELSLGLWLLIKGIDDQKLNLIEAS